MNTLRLLGIIMWNLAIFQQLENVFTKSSILNSPFLEYARNVGQWGKQFPDFTSIILNEHLVQALNDRQHIEDVQSLYNEVISKMYDQVPAQDLAEKLWKMYKKYDVESFITMTRAQLALYWRYRLDRIQDPYFVLLAAHCFYKIKNDVFFSRLNEPMQHLIEASVKSMPSSLQYIFGKDEFCLQNVEYSEIIFQADDHKINHETSHILSSAWSKTEEKALLQPIFEDTEEDNLSDLNLALISKRLQGYFHIMPEYGNIIGANDTKRHLHNFLWSVELVDDNQLVFEQEEYLMCRNGSYLYGIKDKTIYDKECQWTAGQCNDKNN